MQGKGHCKHGEFDLNTGCPQCIADRMAEEGNTEESVAGGIKSADDNAKPVDASLSEVPIETALALRPGADALAVSYYDQAVKLLEYAQAREIKTLDDNKGATNDLSVISKLTKVMTEKRKEYLEPLKIQTEAIRATYSYLMSPVLEADKITRSKMLDYSRIQRELNEAKLELARKEQQAHGEVTTPIELVDEAKKTSTEMGTAGLTDHWTYEIVDLEAIPRAYMMVDNAQLNAIAKRHHDTKQIPGVRFYNEPYLAVRTR